jgi:malate dehydrogenase
MAIIGAGNVGANLALLALQRELAEVVLVDIVPGLAQGKALDLAQAGPVLGYDSRIKGTENYEDIAASTLVVITAGLARRPGMSRADLLDKNSRIVSEVAARVKEMAPEAIILVVTNPLDVMAYVAMKRSGFPRERVLGMAGVLDTARFRFFIAQELGLTHKDIEAMVLGSHGDQMVPLVGGSSVKGRPLGEVLSPDKIAALVQRTRGAGAEIVALLKESSAFYAPAASVFLMAQAILEDKKQVLPASVFAQGEYGLEDVFIGLPARLGRGGVEQIVAIDLPPAELEALHKSAQELKSIMAKLPAGLFEPTK